MDEDEDSPPITVSELVQLSNLGISEHHVTWSRVTMTSDLHICIRYEERNMMQNRAGLQKQLMVVSLRREGGQPKTWPMSPESAMVSPPPPPPEPGGPPSSETARIAIKSGDSLVVLKVVDGWETVAKCEVPRVQFWTWVSFSIIALVTDQNVFHWNIDQGGIPEKVFTRHQRLAFSEIIGYKGDPDMHWLALTGLSPQEDCISGITQLYSVENKLTQCISAHCITFIKYKFDGNKELSTALCVANRENGSANIGKVHVIEMGPHNAGNLAPTSHFDHIKFIEDEERYDFPVSLQVSTVLGLLYIITKYGQLYVCDIETATCLFACCISNNIIFTTALNTHTQGILCVSRSGQVLALDLKLDRLAWYIHKVARKAGPALRLGHVTGFPLDIDEESRAAACASQETPPRRDSTTRPLQGVLPTHGLPSPTTAVAAASAHFSSSVT